MAVGGDSRPPRGHGRPTARTPFREAGLANVVEPDVFGWYLDWSDTVRDGVRSVVHQLKDYDPTTLQVSPEDTRRPPQGPRPGAPRWPVRHALGQYFTLTGWPSSRSTGRDTTASPQFGWSIRHAARVRSSRSPSRASRSASARTTSVTRKRSRPCCATSSASTSIPSRPSPHARTTFSRSAVCSARLRTSLVDVPVYSATRLSPALGERSRRGEVVLRRWPAHSPFRHASTRARSFVASATSQRRGSRRAGTVKTYVKRAASVTDAAAGDRVVLAEFYEACLDRHAHGLDGLWPQCMRNAFMPAFVDRFDLVVGNPPWVNWESLPTAYRERTRPLWSSPGSSCTAAWQPCSVPARKTSRCS